MTTNRVPSFYKFFFTSLDPIIALSAAITNFVSQDFLVDSIVPKTLRNEDGVNPHYKFVFQQAGGGMLACAVLSGGLLRATNDLKLWKYVQLAILLMDFAALYSFWDALHLQGRLSTTAWRSEDWGTVGLTAFITLTRVAFLFEVGFKKVRTGKPSTT